MTSSTPKPNRAPLSAAEYQTLRQLEDDISALKAARAPVADIGRKVAELKRGGLWRREYRAAIMHRRGIPEYPNRVCLSWEKYCSTYLPYTRRYCDQVIRLAGDTAPSGSTVNRFKTAIPGVEPVPTSSDTKGGITGFKLSLAQKPIYEAMMRKAGAVSKSDFLRLCVEFWACEHSFSWPN